MTYRKIPKIRTGTYIFQRPFLRGLFLEGLISGGDYYYYFFCILFIYFLFTGIVQTTYRSKHTNITKFTTTTLTTLDTKLREFQCKILNRILYTNKMLFKFKKVDSPLCDFCGKELETIEHLFFHCTKVSMFWNDLKSVLDSFNITIRFDIRNVLFGILDTARENELRERIPVPHNNFLKSI